jgi:hypothetical protein
VALAGLLLACQAREKPAFLVRAEQNIEDNRRQIYRDVSGR